MYSIETVFMTPAVPNIANNCKVGEMVYFIIPHSSISIKYPFAGVYIKVI